MNLETPAGYQNAQRPIDLKGARHIAQAMLKGRSPIPEEEWSRENDRKFERLFNSNDDFRELLMQELSNENLRTLQEMLDNEA